MNTPPHSRRTIRASFAQKFRPLILQRAQGRPGARCTRGLVCKVHKRKRTRAYRFSGNIRPSLRNGLTAYNVLSPVTGFLATVISGFAIRELDASTGASGPHAFAVRLGRARQSHPWRPPHPAPRP